MSKTLKVSKKSSSKATANKSNWAIFAPSSPTPKAKDLRLGLRVFHELGLKPEFYAPASKYWSKGANSTEHYIAGSDELRVKAFLKIWHDNRITHAMAVRGGYGSLRVVEKLETEALLSARKTPLRVWGFSDLSSLQNYLYLKHNMPWIHGPMLTSTAFTDPQEGESAVREMSSELLPQGHLEFSLKSLSPKKLSTSMAVPVLGGNLACVASLTSVKNLGAPPEPYVLFLEDLNEEAYRLDRLLTQLSVAGWLEQCKGVLLGHFTKCPKAPEVIKAWCKKHGLPAFGYFPAGHDRPNVPLAMGTSLEFGAKKSGDVFLRIPPSAWV